MNTSRPVSRHSGIWIFVLLGVSVLVNVMLLSGLIWDFPEWKNLQARQASLEARIAALDAANAALSQEIRMLQTDELYMEQTIRHRLNFVRDGEILYLFESDREGRGVARDDVKN